MKLTLLRVALILLPFLVAPTGAASGPACSQAVSPEKAIRAVLDAQDAAWNRGDMDAFMTGYWKSDSTEFVGSNGVLHGWQTVLERYRKVYPDRSVRGTLTFSNIEINILCPTAALVTGHYALVREKDHPSGVFTLVFRKFHEGWRIINDHTSALGG